MRLRRKVAVTFALCGMALCPVRGLASPRSAEVVTIGASSTEGSKRKSQRPLSKHERRAVITTALDSRIPRRAEHDCSHLVHAIYQRAGFPYDYAPSDDLYDGVAGFQRVSHPQPADLVVWHGHVGIVTRPSQHLFFSFLNQGPAIDDYRSRYWRGRGQARFYRYLKQVPTPSPGSGQALVSQTVRQ